MKNSFKFLNLLLSFQGYNNWTNGLYGYSWDMMVHAWDTILISVKVIDNANGQVHFLEPYAFSETDRWTKHGDMAVQYSRCIDENIKRNAAKYRNKIKISNNVSIYLDVWCSLNGRFQQRFFNPNIDLLRVDWSPFKKNTFVLPLLKEFTYLRPKLNKLTDEVLSWSNHTDVMFIADFPYFVMDNYISPDLDNVTLSILEGTVIYEEDNENRSQTLTTGERCSVTPNQFHRVRTISSTPSCFMYSFVNKTLQELNSNQEQNHLQKNTLNDGTSIEHQRHKVEDANNNNQNNVMSSDIDDDKDDASQFSIFHEVQHRWENYKKFMAHLANSILYEVYGVPMPRRLKDIS